MVSSCLLSLVHILRVPTDSSPRRLSLMATQHTPRGPDRSIHDFSLHLSDVRLLQHKGYATRPGGASTQLSASKELYPAWAQKTYRKTPASNTQKVLKHDKKRFHVSDLSATTDEKLKYDGTIETAVRLTYPSTRRHNFGSARRAPSHACYDLTTAPLSPLPLGKTLTMETRRLKVGVLTLNETEEMAKDLMTVSKHRRKMDTYLPQRPATSLPKTMSGLHLL